MSSRRPPAHMVALPTTLLTGALLSVTIGIGLYLATAEAIESDTKTRFRAMARAAQYTIDARIKSYSDVLRGAAGLFRVHPDASADDFRHYVEQLDTRRNFPGIEVMNYARTVGPHELAAVDAELRRRLRQHGVPEPSERLRPVPGRDSYTIITYMEPATPQTLDKLDLDLEARSYARRTAGEARDNNTIAASGIRVSMLPGPNQNGLAMRLPVYRSGLPIRTVAERRAAYVGSAGIGFGVTKLVSGVLDEFPVKGVRLVLNDLTEVPAEPGQARTSAILYDSHATVKTPFPPPVADPANLLQASLPIEFNQRQWRADFSIAKPALYTRFDLYYPWMAALAGTLSTALLYALFQTMASSRRSALRIAEDMTRELRSSQAKLQATNEKLRQLAAHAEQIKEGERKRIAREIHDDLAQNLLALKIEAEILSSRTRGKHGRLHERAAATVRQIDTTIRSVRQIINDLRPNVLDLGLNAAVDWQVADFERRTGIACELVEDEAEHHLDDHCATALFRILQESLNNVARHARASKVRIDLHQHADMLTMTIRDNGMGMQPGSRYRNGSFGLVGIEERVNILGGSFSISSGPDTGTTIVVTIPMNEHAPGASANEARDRDYALSAMA
ncbi:sensor histidine kinase [Massilia yuzhufengensis]|uniref:Signal transduction histidine kinase n=1 Tax=Massilia yuzhufengensis TaxID=1164594 RepID=A0A1I1T5X9_9BURK|nr:CHASE domain-containing protein [Massilia yuzhufengensis]SFD53992.1 Signal transduction histidine kinase [Massilia yuzhufengensis]